MSGNVTIAMLVFGGLALTQTVLVGAAAFAVGIRRRQRELGMLAAAGASGKQLAATVLAEGFLLAGLAVVLGVVVGIGLVFLASPWMDDLTDNRVPTVVLDAVPIGLAGTIGLLAGIAAAGVPAWTAARMPVLTALSGRRPPTSSARRTLIVGVALIGVSIALALIGSAMLIADSTDGLAPFLLGGGGILGVLGFGACSPWIVERLEWIGLRLPIAGRIALRDAARARSRTSPVVMAILAGLAVAIGIAAMAASSSSAFNQGWQRSMRADQLAVTGRPHEVEQLVAQVELELDAVASAPLPRPLEGADGSERYLYVAVTPEGDAPVINAERQCPACRGFSLSVATPELLVALGVPTELGVVAPDTVLLLVDEAFEARSATLVVSGPTGYEHSETVSARAVVVDASTGESHRLPNAFIAAETATRLGFSSLGDDAGYVIRLDRPVTEADVAAAAAVLGQSGHVEAALPPTDPNALAGLIAVLVAVLVALTITAIAVALGETEARADQRTLLAIGADPRLRRRIVAARAGVIALLAAVLAVPAGLLPAWGLYAGRGQPLVIPLPEIVVVLVALPLVAIAGALLLSRPMPVWSAFRDI